MDDVLPLTGLAPVAAALVVLDLYAIGRAVLRGHGVEGTLAWIFAILALPGVGAAAYLLLSSPSIRRTARRRRASRARLRGSGMPRDPAAAPSGAPDPGPTLPGDASPDGPGSLLTLATAVTGLPPSRGNAVVLLVENDRAFAEIERAILSATRQVWAESYIVNDDATGRRFLDLLAARARDGIEVRLLYDAFGSLRISAPHLAAIRAAGGRAEAFLPMNPLRRRWSVHLRNHRKVIVVDGRVGFAGGMNIGDEYSGHLREAPALPFRDSHLAVRGPAVADLAWTFAEDWSFATGESLRRPRTPDAEGDSLVAIVPSGPDQEINASAYVYFAGVAAARRRIFLTSPYFAPDEPTIRALVTAALRGVDVRLLVPSRTDVPFVSSAARSFYPELLRGGVRIFEYGPAMLHAKTVAVDGAWGIVGSANVDVRSFRLNFELSALVADPAFAALLEERFAADLEQSREITRRGVARRTLPQRLRYGFARLLSPLL